MRGQWLLHNSTPDRTGVKPQVRSWQPDVSVYFCLSVQSSRRLTHPLTPLGESFFACNAGLVMYRLVNDMFFGVMS